MGKFTIEPRRHCGTVILGAKYPKKRIKQTPPKVKPKLKSLTSNQVRKKIAKGELR